MKKSKSSIKNKLIGISLITSFCSLTIGLTILIHNSISSYRKDIVNTSVMNAKLMTEYLVTPLEFQYSSAAYEVLEKLVTIPDVFQGVVYSIDRSIFAEYYKSENHKHLDKVIYFEEVSFIKNKYLYIYQPIVNQDKVYGVLYLKISVEKIGQRIQHYIQMILILIFGIAVFSYFLALILQKSISNPLLNLAILLKKFSDDENFKFTLDYSKPNEIGTLYSGFSNMTQKIQSKINERDEANRALRERTVELSNALNELRETQNQLIQSEKMAALGQLIAGVAHEVNTPLGAIRSSVSNILLNVQDISGSFSEFIRNLTLDEYLFFTKILSVSLRKSNNFSAKEERKLKRAMMENLEMHGVTQAVNFADTFIDMGVYDLNFDLSVLKSESSINIIQNAYKISSIFRSALNIQLATDRASKIVFALKNYARYDHSGQMIKASIIDTIETVLTLYHNQLKHGVDVIKNFEELPDFLCYPDELNQVWTNLIHNAVQAMNNHGTLEINVFRKENNACVEIIDSGEGISKENLDLIFEPFFTTKSKGEGSGLGLDIVKKIIEKHNGRIHVDSVPGHTVFKICLPLNP